MALGVYKLDREQFVTIEAADFLRYAMASSLILNQQLIALHLLHGLGNLIHKLMKLKPLLPRIHQHDLRRLLRVLALRRLCHVTVALYLLRVLRDDVAREAVGPVALLGERREARPVDAAAATRRSIRSRTAISCWSAPVTGPLRGAFALAIVPFLSANLSS